MGTDAPRPLVAGLKDPMEGPMKALPIKLPPTDVARLRLQAERLHCYPSALARALVLRGLTELDGEVG